MEEVKNPNNPHEVLRRYLALRDELFAAKAAKNHEEIKRIEALFGPLTELYWEVLQNTDVTGEVVEKERKAAHDDACLRT